ncbi:hypothetical protein PS029_19370 [Yersinia pestis]|nr:hypothetical protein [Yersinia pestis]
MKIGIKIVNEKIMFQGEFIVLKRLYDVNMFQVSVLKFQVLPTIPKGEIVGI